MRQLGTFLVFASTLASPFARAAIEPRLGLHCSSPDTRVSLNGEIKQAQDSSSPSTRVSVVEGNLNVRVDESEAHRTLQSKLRFQGQVVAPQPGLSAASSKPSILLKSFESNRLGELRISMDARKPSTFEVDRQFVQVECSLENLTPRSREFVTPNRN